MRATLLALIQTHAQSALTISLPFHALTIIVMNVESEYDTIEDDSSLVCLIDISSCLDLFLLFQHCLSFSKLLYFVA